MMRKCTILVLFSLTLTALANHDSKGWTRQSHSHETTVSADTILREYADSLRRLVDGYHADLLGRQGGGATILSPYFYQMVTPGTLYKSPVRQALGLNWKPGGLQPYVHLVSREVLDDPELSRLFYTHQALGSMYVSHPGLVTVTEKEISENALLVKDTDVPIKSDVKMKEEVQLSELEHEDVGEVMAIVRKPNFWKFGGSNSLNLTQNFATDNWFQGKANHYNVLGIVAIDANLNNQRKIQWDNRIDLQLGFQTNSESEQNKFKPTNNLFRLNSKLGVKAAKNWYYTFNVKAETQLVPNYQYKKQKDEKGNEFTRRSVITDFLAPLNVDISVGVDWKWNLKRFTGSLYMAPGTYNIKYVDRLSLSTRYGIDEGHHTKSTFGPSATAKFNWKIAENIKWDSRLYWISNLHYTNVEFENTITFSINKYLTSKFYFYPRFNDQSLKNRMPDADGKNTGTYWMFKEWLSLGISYNW